MKAVFRSAAAFVLTALAVVGLARPAAAGNQVPFQGSLEGIVTHTPIDPVFDSVLVDATGIATQLGQFTLAIPHIVNHTNGTAVGTYEFTAANGATWVVPGSQQRDAPAESDLKRTECVECAAGAMLVFDSTLWHCAGRNHSGKDRLAINHQFTRSYVKQQIDYVRALGDAMILGLPARTQQLLGYYTRVVTSLDEYYRPGPERLYRSGQG